MTPKEHAKVLAALEAVAPEEPINQDEQGGCVWCGGTPPGSPYGYATSNRTHHEEDCCWVLARDAIAIMRKEPEPISDAEIWKQAVMLAYGHLWHVNNEPMAPIPMRSPEKAAYAARKVLLDLLTHEERGLAINAVRELLEKK